MASKRVVSPKPNEERKIPKGIEKALVERKSGVDSEAFLNDLIEVWGGPRQLALDIHDEYEKAPPGGMVRQRIMEMLGRLIVNNTLHDIGKSAKPSDMTKEELEAMAMRYVKRLTQEKSSAGTTAAP